MELALQIESWPYKQPFHITNYVFTGAEVLVVTLRDGAYTGRGEANGVYYHDETPVRMSAQIEALRDKIENGLDRDSLRSLMPPGGARNALDCALWELESRRAGLPVWKLAHVREPVALRTTCTVGAGSPEQMAAGASAYTQARAIKMKLTGADAAACVQAVRAARPDVWIGVDANQAFTRQTLEDLLPTLIEAKVGLIEQPLPRGEDAALAGLQSPIPLAADESVQSLRDIEPIAAPYYNLINIKLDKCGGLTEGLLMAHAAHRLNLGVMVGCMNATSLAMAPAFVLGQLCDYVDLDAPLVLSRDRTPFVEYADGNIYCSEAVWGAAA